MFTIRWLTPDLGEALAHFRERLGFTVDADDRTGRLALSNALIEIVPPHESKEADAPRRVGWERLELDREHESDSSESGPEPVHRNGAADLLAVGLGTVDHERAIGSLALGPFVFAGIDPLLGAGAWLSLRAMPPSWLLLEPEREGPLTAALARNGEGPLALYIRVRARRWDALKSELAGRGTSVRGPASIAFGDAYLARPSRPWGPFVIFVRVPSPGGDAGDHREARHA